MIQVLDVNERPTSPRLSSISIVENDPPDSLVGYVISFDPDNEVNETQSLVFVLDNDNGSAPFVLNGTNLLTTAVLDAEKRSSYTVRLTVIDTGVPSLSATTNVTIIVKDVNDPPTSLDFISVGVNENSPGGTTAGYLRAEDEDRRQNYTYTIIPFDDITSKRGGSLRRSFTVNFFSRQIFY